MSMRDLLPTLEQLQHVEGIERDLLRRRRTGALTGYAALLAAVAQVVFALAGREEYLANIGRALLALVRLDLGVLLTRPEALGLLALTTATLAWLLLRRTSFLMRESREPFRYTFWIDPFQQVADALPENVAVRYQERLQLLNRDLTERLNQRIARRFSLLDPAKLNDGERALLTSHVRIGGTYALRVRGEDELTVHVMPHIGIGAPGTPEVLAEPVYYPLLPDRAAGDTDADISLTTERYDQLVERVYSSVATRVYDQIRSDVREKMRLFPTGYLRAVAYFHEAQDFERSNTVDAYDHAIALYREARRYFETHRIEVVSCAVARLPLLWRINRRSRHMEARTRVGYARCLIYRRLVSALSGRPRNALYEVQDELKSARDSLTTLFNHVAAAGRRRMHPAPERVQPVTRTPADARNRSNAFLAALAVPRDGVLRRGSARFEATRDALVEACTVSALAYAQLEALGWARVLLDLAAAIDPANGQDNPLWLLAEAEIEPVADQKRLLLRRATEIAPAFEIARFQYAATAETLLRAQDDLSVERVRSVVAEYEHVLRINPGNVGARAAQAYLWWLAGDLTRARKHYEAGLEIKATVSQTFVGDLTYGLARVLAETGSAADANQSFALYNSALSADPGVAAYSANVGTRAEHTYYNFISPSMLFRYRQFRRRVRDAYARRHPQRAAEVPDRVARLLYSFALNDAGNAAINFYLRFGDRRHLQLAVRALQGAVAVDPSNMVARYNLSVACSWRAERDDAERARQLLEEVVAALPTWSAAVTASTQLAVRFTRREVDRLQAELDEERQRAESKAKEAEALEAEARRTETSTALASLLAEARVTPWPGGEHAADSAPPSPAQHEQTKELENEVQKRRGTPSGQRSSVATRGRARSPVSGQPSAIDPTTAAQKARAEERKHREDAAELANRLGIEQRGLKRLVGEARSLIGRHTRLSPLFTTGDRDGRSSLAQLLANRRLRWERLDDAVVQALGSWAGISADSREAEGLLEAEQLCREITARYNPEDFDAHSVLQTILESRLTRESDEQRRVEIQQQIDECRHVIRFAIETWVRHDPIHYTALEWVWQEDYFDEDARLAALERAVRLRPDDRSYGDRVAGFYATAARDHAVRGHYEEAIERFGRALQLCPWQGRFHLELADIREKWQVPGRRLEELDAALAALERAAALGVSVPSERVRRLRTQRAVAQHAGVAALDRPMIAVPVAIEVADDLVPSIADDDGLLKEVADLVDEMRGIIHDDRGIHVPGVRFRGSTDLPPQTYIILLFDVPIVMGTVEYGARLFPSDPQPFVERGVPVTYATNPFTSGPAAWVSEDHLAALPEAESSSWSPVEYMMRHLEAVLRYNLAAFVRHQDVHFLVADSGIEPPVQAKEMADLVMVLRALVSEGVTVRPLRDIIVEFRRLRQQGASLLQSTEALRMLPQLRWQLPGAHAGELLRLHAAFESQLLAALHRTGDTTVLAMDPNACQEALSAIRYALTDRDDAAIVVEAAELRPFVRKLIELEWPRVPVLAAAELKPRLRELPMQEIALEVV